MGTSNDICAKLTEGSVASWIGEEMCLLGADGSLASVNESGSAVLKSLFEGMTLREAAVKYAEGRGIRWSTVALDATRMLSSLAEAGYWCELTRRLAEVELHECARNRSLYPTAQRMALDNVEGTRDPVTAIVFHRFS